MADFNFTHTTLSNEKEPAETHELLVMQNPRLILGSSDSAQYHKAINEHTDSSEDGQMQESKDRSKSVSVKESELSPKSIKRAHKENENHAM